MLSPANSCDRTMPCPGFSRHRFCPTTYFLLASRASLLPYHAPYAQDKRSPRRSQEAAQLKGWLSVARANPPARESSSALDPRGAGVVQMGTLADEFSALHTSIGPRFGAFPGAPGPPVYISPAKPRVTAGGVSHPAGRPVMSKVMPKTQGHNGHRAPAGARPPGKLGRK